EGFYDQGYPPDNAAPSFVDQIPDLMRHTGAKPAHRNREVVFLHSLQLALPDAAPVWLTRHANRHCGQVESQQPLRDIPTMVLVTDGGGRHCHWKADARTPSPAYDLSAS